MASPHQLRPVSMLEPVQPPPLAGGGYQLLVERTATGALLRVVGGDGTQSLELALTPAGPVLRLRAGLAITVEGELALTAEQISLHARGALRLTSDERVDIRSGGDVAVGANDDVKLNGERIELNC